MYASVPNGTAAGARSAAIEGRVSGRFVMVSPPPLEQHSGATRMPVRRDKAAPIPRIQRRSSAVAGKDTAR